MSKTKKYMYIFFYEIFNYNLFNTRAGRVIAASLSLKKYIQT